MPAMEEAALRVRDLTMAQSFNSGERELSEWVELFESATPKLKLKEWKKPWGSVMSVMVVVRDEEVKEGTEVAGEVQVLDGELSGQ